MSRKYAISMVLVIWLLGLGAGLWISWRWPQPTAVDLSSSEEKPRQLAQLKTVPSDAELTAKLEQLRQQMGPSFRTAIVKPFVVTSNQSAQDFERTCQKTIRWAVQMLKKDFFSKSPDKIITIYLSHILFFV